MTDGGRLARRAALAATGGFLLYAAHPPLDWGPAGAVAVVPLLALARDVSTGARPVRAGWGWGTVAGLVFFLPLLTWIGRFGYAPWTLLSLVQGLFVGAFVAVVAAWGRRPGRILVAVAAWVAMEWLRSRVPLSGFPWGLLGYSQHSGGPVLPLAAITGVLGVSAVLVAVAGAVESLLAAVLARDGRRAVVGPLVAVGLVVLVLVVPQVWQVTPEATGETVDMAAVQGNDVELPPFVDRENTVRVLDVAERMVVATDRLGNAEGPLPDVVVWPENSLDDDPRTNPDLATKVEQAQAAIGEATLLAGVLLEGERPDTFTNTIVRFGDAASVEDVYDKRVMVPFGEYVPFRSVLGELPPLRAIPADGVPGDRPHVFDIDGTPVGPITCFESIYPDLVRDQVREGAEVLVVSTNNASFGRSPASRQHLTFSQLRAVETGRWVLHAGISGISAVVDPQGRLSQQTGLFEQAIVRADFPLVAGNTPFVVAGDVVGLLSVLGLAGVVGWLVVARRRGDADDRAGAPASGSAPRTSRRTSRGR